MNNYVDVVAFQRRNHLTQGDIANFLGVSRSFISLVAKGKSKLTDMAIHKIVMESDWDTTDLVPCFTRFCDVWRDYVESRGGELPVWPLEDINPFGISDGIVQDLFYGRIGLNDRIANSVMKIVPNLNREWFLTGVGYRYLSKMKTPTDLLEEVGAKLDAILERISVIERRLEAIEAK